METREDIVCPDCGQPIKPLDKGLSFYCERCVEVIPLKKARRAIAAEYGDLRPLCDTPGCYAPSSLIWQNQNYCVKHYEQKSEEKRN